MPVDLRKNGVYTSYTQAEAVTKPSSPTRSKLRMRTRTKVLLVSALVLASTVCAALEIKEYPVPQGAHPHDLAPAADGGVWYTAQHQAALGWLDPKTGKTRHIPLGKDSA